MAKKANLKKEVKGPMKMKSGSFLEPNKELKFGGIKKYVKGGDPEQTEGEQFREELLQSISYSDAKEFGKLSEWYRANPNAKETKQANQANRDKISGSTSGYSNVGRPLVQGGNSPKPRKNDIREASHRGGIGAIKPTPNTKPTPNLGEGYTRGGIGTPKNLGEGYTRGGIGTPKATSNESSKPASSRPTPSRPASSKPTPSRPTPSRSAPAKATAVSRGKQATSVSSSKPTAELQLSRRTVPSASSEKTMSKGKSYSKDSFKETNKMTDRRASSTSSKEKRQDSKDKQPSNRVNRLEKRTQRVIERKENRDQRQNSKSSRRENIKSAKANLKAARRG